MAEIQRGVIPVAIAARVLKMDCQTLRLLLQNKMVGPMSRFSTS